MKIRTLYCLLAVAISVSGCSLTPKKPDPLPPAPEPEPKISDISIPVDIQFSGARTYINKSLPIELYRVSNVPIFKGKESVESNNSHEEFVKNIKIDKKLYMEMLEKEMDKNTTPVAEREKIRESNNIMIDTFNTLKNTSNPDNKEKIFSGTYQVIVKRKQINLDFKNDTIISSTRINGDARADWLLCLGVWHDGECIGLETKHHDDSYFIGNVLFKSKISIDEDWQLKSKTKADTQVLLAAIKVGPFVIFINDYVKLEANKKLRQRTEKFDNSISDSINLDEIANISWSAFAKPYQISENPLAWLQFSPNEFAWGGITKVGDDVARFELGVKSWSKFTLASEPDHLDIGELPKIVTRPLSESTIINTPIIIDMAYATSIIKKSVTNKTFMVKNNVIMTVRDIDLFVNGENVVIKVSFSADLPDRWLDTKGLMYLIGKPVYNKTTRNLEVTNIDFDIHTNRALINAAAYLLHKPMVKKIEELMVIPIGEKLEEITRSARRAVKDVPLGNNARFKGEINSINVDGIYTSKNKDVGVNVYLNGKSKVLVLNQAKKLRD